MVNQMDKFPCNKCRRPLLRNHENFRRKAARPDGFSYTCKTCEREMQLVCREQRLLRDEQEERKRERLREAKVREKRKKEPERYQKYLEFARKDCKERNTRRQMREGKIAPDLVRGGRVSGKENSCWVQGLVEA
jgi:hypothetical protein